MSLNPNKLGWMEKTDFLPILSFEKIAKFVVQSSGAIGTNMEIGLSHNTDAASVEGGTGITAERTILAETPVIQVSAAAGNPEFTEIGTTGHVGCKMNTAGDSAQLFMRLPNIWALRHRIRFRVVWATDSTTAADTVDWKLLYKKYVPDAAAIATPSTALSTAIAQDTAKGTAKYIQQTAWGVLNGGTLKKAAPYNEYISLLVEMDAKAGGLSEDIWALGLEVAYTPRSGRGLQKLARRFTRSQD